MLHKILVTYASRLGSTEAIARHIGKSLTEAGFEVDCLPTRSVTTMDSYDAIILGSAVRGGKWLPEGKYFLEDNLDQLTAKPLALFTVCLTLKEDTPENRAKAETFLSPLLTAHPELKPLALGYFAGSLNPNKVPFFLGLITRFIKIPSGDFRNWRLISHWAELLGQQLRAS